MWPFNTIPGPSSGHRTVACPGWQCTDQVLPTYRLLALVKHRLAPLPRIAGSEAFAGLAAAAGHAPVGRLKHSAAARIGASDADEPVVYPY